MTENDAITTDIFEHRPGNFARKGSLFLPVAVLGGQSEILSPQSVANGSQGREGRGNDHLAIFEGVQLAAARYPTKKPPRQWSCAFSSWRQ